ncbi:MAG: hypothetical protein KKA84_06740 [Bacteroidetes bacterium]|nr:hypothetical protein [Bacteroidota bacterium]
MAIGRLLLNANIKLLSPLLIGSGNDDYSDIDAILDEYNQPFIPATSFVGVLAHHLKEENFQYSEQDREFLEKLFGYSKKVNGQHESWQSKLYCSDLNLVDSAHLTTRDGIRIDSKTNIIKPKGKFDFQTVDAGAEFRLKLEAEYKDESFRLFVLRIFQTIISELTCHNDEKLGYEIPIRIGAKTNNGLGRVTIENHEISDYSFSKIDDVIAWLGGGKAPVKEDLVQTPYGKLNTDFVIDGYFDLKTSVIMRAYSSDPSAPDASHIKSAGKNILTGTGVKGVIRARARRILFTLFGYDNPRAEEIFSKLFGYVDEDSESDVKAAKSRIQIEETVLPAYPEELHTRIKIDRFTGGTIKAALFDTMPLFSSDIDTDKEAIRVIMKIENFDDHEAGLLLLILKDLWTMDLPVGGEKGIGRGVLEGIGAKIIIKDDEINIGKDIAQLTEEEKIKLSDLVVKLNNLVKSEEVSNATII